MPIVELWSEQEQAFCEALRRAVEQGDLAGALLAIEGASEARASWARGAIEQLVWQVKSRSPVAREAPEQARLLAQVLGGAGFRGDRDEYHAPRNSHLGSVLERKSGLPILLSAVWVLVGQGAGFVVEGVGLPAHFIARVGGEQGVYVDPFSGGDTLSVNDCQRLVARLSQGRLAWRDDMLRPAAPHDLLERVLRNLMNSHGREDDLPRLYQITRLWSTLTPGSPEPILLRAGVAEKLGVTRVAAEAYAEICDRFGGTDEARRAGERITALRRRAAVN
jgi:regulator of sirC expression with transglutaminase-like and TPR domain